MSEESIFEHDSTSFLLWSESYTSCPRTLSGEVHDLLHHSSSKKTRRGYHCYGGKPTTHSILEYANKGLAVPRDHPEIFAEDVRQNSFSKSLFDDLMRNPDPCKPLNPYESLPTPKKEHMENMSKVYNIV